MEQRKVNPEKLRISVIDRPNDPNFDAVYDLYERVFTLEEERETKANFLIDAANNLRPERQAKLATSRWVYLTDETNDQIVGATYFHVFAGSQTKGFDGTLHATYTFIDPAYRKQGISEKLVAERERIASEYCQSVLPLGHAPVIVTIGEQNSPFKMTANQFLADADQLDPSLRRDIYEHNGFRNAEFPYTQPQLAPELPECRYLDIVVKAPGNPAAIPASLLREHFTRFFEKVFSPEINQDTAAMHAMWDSLKGGNIVLSQTEKYRVLKKYLTNAMVENVPEVDRDKPLGELFPVLHFNFKMPRGPKLAI